MASIETLLRERGGIRLDIGCGANPQQGFVGMDIRAEVHPDIIWDFNVHPWPLPDECVLVAMASHVLEHVPGCVIDGGRTRFPFIEFLDDVWRVLRPGGEFMASVPHGRSRGFLQDPTHVNAMNEARWAYFDPGLVDGHGNSRSLWGIYRPKPWRLKHLSFDPSSNIEVIMIKRALDDNTPTTISFGGTK